MPADLPLYIPALFIATTFLTLAFLYFACKSSGLKISNFLLLCIPAWLALTAVLANNGLFSTDTRSMPPKFAVAVLPPLLIILIAFLTKAGRAFIDSVSLKAVTYLHVVRIPVELGLYWLFVYKAVPQLMTFEGRNFDVISGITAPAIAYLVFNRQKGGKALLLAWNFLALGLLINIVANAVLSAPFAFQKFGFDQPNIAVLHFPFVWLPAFIVPAVLFCHLVSIRQLLKSNGEK